MFKVLLEGPELVGKSTIAKYLADHFTHGQIEKHIMPEDSVDLYKSAKQFTDSLRLGKGISIVDRFFYPSDIIYSRVYNDGRPSPLEEKERELATMFNRHQLLIIYVTAGEDVVADRFDVRNDEYLNKQQCIDSVMNYEKFFDRVPLNPATLDTSKLSIEEMCSKALYIVENWLKDLIVDDPQNVIGGVELDRKDLIKQLLETIGEDTEREGLIGTPDRVDRMYNEIFGGYDVDPKQFLTTTFENAPGDEIVLIRDIEFWSHCEHHMVPFFGKAHVAYIPKDGKVVGISKIARMVDGFARRLQIQERLTKQIADAMKEMLDPVGIAVIIEADHLCMKMRGIKNPCANTVTSEMRGAFRNVPSARQELFALIELRK